MTTGDFKVVVVSNNEVVGLMRFLDKKTSERLFEQHLNSNHKSGEITIITIIGRG